MLERKGIDREGGHAAELLPLDRDGAATTRAAPVQRHVDGAAPAGGQGGVRCDGAVAAFDDAVSAGLGRGGAPLPGGLRGAFEQSLGADLSSVRVHTGADADAAARAIDARAFATGQDVFFRDGAYRPDTSDGAWLLAHEVAHTVQQGHGDAVQGKLEVSEAGDASEVEADRAADAMVAGAPAAVSALAPGVGRKVARFGSGEYRSVRSAPFGDTLPGADDDSRVGFNGYLQHFGVGRGLLSSGYVGPGNSEVHVQYGTAGAIRFRVVLGYEINRLVNESGSCVIYAGMNYEFRDGQLVWTTPISLGYESGGPPRRFTIGSTQSGSGSNMEVNFALTGASVTGGQTQIQVGAERGPVSGQLQHTGEQRTYGAGVLPIGYGARVVIDGAPPPGTQPGNGGGGGGGGGNNNQNSNSNSNRNNNSNGATGGDAENHAQGGNAQGGSATSTANGGAGGAGGAGGSSTASGGAGGSSTANGGTQTANGGAGGNSTNTVQGGNTYIQIGPQGQQGTPGPAPQGGGDAGFASGDIAAQSNFSVDDDQLLTQGGAPAPLARLNSQLRDYVERHRAAIDRGEVRFVFWGFTSRTGTVEHNRALSQARARAAADAARVALPGLPDTAFGEPRGFGTSTSPAPSGHESSDDRRVEIRVQRVTRAP